MYKVSIFYLLLIFYACLIRLLLQSSLGLGDSGSLCFGVWCRRCYLATGSVFIICLTSHYYSHLCSLILLIYVFLQDRHHCSYLLIWLRCGKENEVWQWYSWDWCAFGSGLSFYCSLFPPRTPSMCVPLYRIMITCRKLGIVRRFRGRAGEGIGTVDTAISLLGTALSTYDGGMVSRGVCDAAG